MDNFSLKWKTLGHRSAISGLACNRTSDILVSVSKDSIINMWDISDEAYWANNCEVNAVNTITTSVSLYYLLEFNLFIGLIPTCVSLYYLLKFVIFVGICKLFTGI